MEDILSKLQILLDEIEHEGLDLESTTEKLKEIVDDASNAFDSDYTEDEINY